MAVEETAFPHECDAVILGLTDSQARPRIILNSSRPRTRRRFTLAHELGHFRIPWHVGTIVCHTDLRVRESREDDLLHRASEGEANRFASELLIPQEWLTDLFETEPTRAAALARVAEADVSPPAACYALAEFLGPGHVLVVLEPSRVVRYLFQSPGTSVNVPYRGSRLDTGSLDSLAADHATLPFGSQAIHWWYFEQERDLLISDDPRSPTEILRGMLSDVIDAPEEQESLFKSIEGIAGAAKNASARYDPEALHAVLRQRVAHRWWFDQFAAHADFPLWLSRRAEQLARPRGQK
jgi:IrrE N-terminal-like domain